MVRKLFLTPPELPSESQCRSIEIPSSREWLGIFNAALLQTIYPYNYEQVNETDLTAEETASAANEIVMEYFESLCSGGSCDFDGIPVLRVSETGEVQQLIDGEWVAPTGDYALPPPAARVGGTAAQRKCLAARNAANVFEGLYEELIDAYAIDIDPYFGLAATGAFLGATVLVGLGLVSFGVGFVIAGAFAAFYEVMGQLTADLWDAQFTEDLVCILLHNATDTAGVVTFDFEGVISDLAAATTIDYAASSIRLFGQIAFMLRTVGAQGLDLAGGTTAITDNDCTDCDPAWKLIYDATIGNGGFSAFASGASWVAAAGATWVEGLGWVSGRYTKGASERKIELAIRRTLPTILNCTQVKVVGHFIAGIVVPSGSAQYLAMETESPTHTVFFQSFPVGDVFVKAVTESQTTRAWNIQTRPSVRNDAGEPSGSAVISRVEWQGTGTAPTLPSGTGWAYG